MTRVGLRLALLIVLAGLVQIACSLNPQPIPPWQEDNEGNPAEGSSSGGFGSSGDSTGGSSSGGLPTTPQDAGRTDSDAGDQNLDAGDAGTEEDAGDAGTEEDAGDAG